MNYNKIILMGRLVREPELRRTQNNTAVAGFTLAVNRPKGKDGTQTADFFDCVAWGKTAEFVSKYFVKGQLMHVDGAMQARDWTDKQGQKRRSWEVQAQQVDFAEGRKDAPSGPVSAGDFVDMDDDDGELPF